MRKIRTNLLSPIDRDTLSHLEDQVIVWSDERIEEIRPYDPGRDFNCEDLRSCLALPGFIDVHVHLSQYRVRGRYEPSLLSWLQEHVFPAEAHSAKEAYAVSIAEEFFSALFAQGATTSVIYTAPYAIALETAFATAKRMGARAFIGMTLMDRNSPDDLIQGTQRALELSIDQHQRYSNVSPLLDYIFTPRFALSCSTDLMRGLANYAESHHAWIQTHLSENHEEIRQVKAMFGAESYTRVYEEMGLLTPKTILAHAIHLTDNEIGTLARHGCKIAHCPDSNFFLKSGEFDYPRLAAAGLPIGIGSDVAAGSTLNMLYHAKMANYRQSSHSLSPARLLYHITLGNAALLGMDSQIGSLEAGKQADLCFLDASDLPSDTAELASALCFWGHEIKVKETVIAGRSVYRI